MFDKLKEIQETLRRRRNMNKTIKALHQLDDLELLIFSTSYNFSNPTTQESKKND